MTSSIESARRRSAGASRREDRRRLFDFVIAVILIGAVALGLVAMDRPDHVAPPPPMQTIR